MRRADGPQTRAIPVRISPFLKDSPNQDARDCLMAMGLTSENVAEEYNIPRSRQDAFAANSHQKALAAQKAGHFDAEIVPIDVRYVDQPIEGSGEPGPTSTRHVSKDEGIRPTATAESMGKLKPAFKENGGSTAGNSSQISDGASAVTLARRDVAERHGLKPIGRFVGTSVVGVPPRIMGVGPAFAVPHLLKKYGLSVGDIDIWELNEGAFAPGYLFRYALTKRTAFASQALMTIDHLGLDEAKVNPKGGAIALGCGRWHSRLPASILRRRAGIPWARPAVVSSARSSPSCTGRARRSAWRRSAAALASARLRSLVRRPSCISH